MFETVFEGCSVTYIYLLKGKSNAYGKKKNKLVLLFMSFPMGAHTDVAHRQIYVRDTHPQVTVACTSRTPQRHPRTDRRETDSTGHGLH